MTTTQFSPAMERFFEELRKLKLAWRLNECGAIVGRSGRSNVCPVCAVANARMGEVTYRINYWVAFSDAGLEETDASRIACAADRREFHNPALRARLLECCGLSEVANG